MASSQRMWDVGEVAETVRGIKTTTRLSIAQPLPTPLVPNAVIGMDRKPTAAELAAAYSKDGPQFLGHNVHAADYDPRAITIDHGNDIGNDTAFRHYYILIPTR